MRSGIVREGQLYFSDSVSGKAICFSSLQKREFSVPAAQLTADDADKTDKNGSDKKWSDPF